MPVPGRVRLFGANGVEDAGRLGLLDIEDGDADQAR